MNINPTTMAESLQALWSDFRALQEAVGTMDTDIGTRLTDHDELLSSIVNSRIVPLEEQIVELRRNLGSISAYLTDENRVEHGMEAHYRYEAVKALRQTDTPLKPLEITQIRAEDCDGEPERHTDTLRNHTYYRCSRRGCPLDFGSTDREYANEQEYDLAHGRTSEAAGQGLKLWHCKAIDHTSSPFKHCQSVVIAKSKERALEICKMNHRTFIWMSQNVEEVQLTDETAFMSHISEHL